MDHEVRIEGPTPAGGTYAIGRFFYRGAPCHPDHADSVETTEYTADGSVVQSTYGRQTPRLGPPTEDQRPAGEEAADALLEKLCRIQEEGGEQAEEALKMLSVARTTMSASEFSNIERMYREAGLI